MMETNPDRTNCMRVWIYVQQNIYTLIWSVLPFFSFILSTFFSSLCSSTIGYIEREEEEGKEAPYAFSTTQMTGK